MTRTENISGNQDHGKVIKTRAPGAARDAGATGTGGEHQEQQEQLLLASMGACNSNDRIDQGGRKGDNGERHLNVGVEFVKVLQISRRASQLPLPCCNDSNHAGISIAQHLLQLDQLRLREH